MWSIVGIKKMSEKQFVEPTLMLECTLLYVMRSVRAQVLCLNFGELYFRM